MSKKKINLEDIDFTILSIENTITHLMSEWKKLQAQRRSAVKKVHKDVYKI